MKVHSLSPPFTIDGLEDGCAYSLPGISLAPSNLFLKIGREGDLFVKVPSSYALQDLRPFIDRPESLPDWNIRQPSDPERFENLKDALSVPAFTELRRLDSLGSEAVYYLLLFMMQYRRLRNQAYVRIPRARFGALRLRRFGFFDRFTPALFQERIPGTTLWEMFDFDADSVRPEWHATIPQFAEQLAGLISSPAFNHIDWNIKNFVFQPESEELFYIDQKPTLFVAGHGNEHNLNGIRQHFLV